MLLKPNPTNHCFACGGANARGMQLAFDQDDSSQRIRGEFSISGEYQGGSGFVHGGIIALLLDEVMAKVSRFHKDHAVTAALDVEYVKPVPVGQPLVIEGWEVERNGRNIQRAGEIRSSAGLVLARGHGHFVQVDPERFRKAVATAFSQPDDSATGKL